jgi:hypothetical protein
VEIWEGGAFTMQGGTISGNSAESSGGGESVKVGDSTFAIFTMEGGTIYGNTAQNGGGVRVGDGSTFTMEGGTIYGKTDRLPLDVDPSFANIASNYAALTTDGTAAKWGTGGTYTQGGVDKTGGGDIGSTDDTLIAIPAPQ